MTLDAHAETGPDEQWAVDSYRTQQEEQKVTLGRDMSGVDNRYGSGASTDPTYNGDKRRSVWSRRQLESVALRVGLVLALFGLIGYVFGSASSRDYVASSEFVYTLDESVPDSFLREDRRLLTQMATLQSDAVLAPVAETFALTAEDLRDAITIETVELSEVLRLDVSDTDPDLALAINRAVMDEYLTIVSRPPPEERTDALRNRRTEIVDDLRQTDSALLGLQQNRLVDPGLATAEESLERQITLRNDQIDRLQGLLDGSLARPIARSRRNQLAAELEESQEVLTTLEAELADLRVDRAKLAAETAQESALIRDVDRFEAELNIIEVELAERELRPLIVSPIRVLAEPTVTPKSNRLDVLRGVAIGILVALPLAGLLAYWTRKRQLWFGP